MKNASSFRHNILCVYLVLALSFFIVFTIKWAPKMTVGFVSYYTYAKLLSGDGDFHKLYSFSYFNEKIKEFGISGILDMPNNLPTNAYAFIPFIGLTPVHAKIPWTIISVIMLAGSIALLLRTFEVSPGGTLGMGFMTLVLLWRPVYENISYGQLYIFLLFLFCISLYGIKRSRLLATSLPLSAMLLLKGYGGIQVIWLILARRWKETFTVVSSILLVVIVSLPIIDREIWSVYSRDVVSTMGQLPAHSITVYQTVNGMIRHLFTYDRTWLPAPLVVLPPLVTGALSTAANLLIVALVLRYAVNAEKEDSILVYSAAFAAGVVTSPLASEYHYIFFLPLILGLLKNRFEEWGERKKQDIPDYVFYAAIIVMAIPFNYKALNTQPMPVIFFAYPKLYAGLAILYYFSRVMGTKRKVSHVSPEPLAVM